MSRPTLYAHPKCSTCQAARAWLQQNGIAFAERDIREHPPGPDELRTMLAANEGKLSRISNTSGLEYRAQGLGAKLPDLDQAAALRLLGSNGMFLKRPFLIGPGIALVGFKEPAWRSALRRT